MKKLVYLISLILAISGCRSIKQIKLEDNNIIDITDTLSKPVKEMSFDEVYLAKQYYEQKQDHEMTIKCGERLINLANEEEKTQKTLLQLAQLNLDKGKLKDCKKHAKEYQVLYPGSEEAMNAAYIELKASYLSMLSPDRDQTETHNTLKLAQSFKDKYSNQDKYKSSVKDIRDNCYTRLIDSEVGIVDSYLSKYNWSAKETCLTAAQNRIEHIKEKLLPYQLAHEPRIMALEIKLAQATAKPELISEKEKALEKKYPLYAQREKANAIKKVLRKF